MSDEVLVCMRVSKMTTTPVSGSIMTFCHECHEDVWIAKSGQEVLARDPTMKVMCVQCAMPLIRLHGAEVMPAPGAIDELKEELGDVGVYGGRQHGGQSRADEHDSYS